MDKLSQDMLQCEKDGFGVHYGAWKATQPKQEPQERELTDGWKRCEYCGKPFKKNRGMRFCDVYCRTQAYEDKAKVIRAEYYIKSKKKKLACATGTGE